MAHDFQRLIQRYLDVWNETDGARRLDAIEALYTEDCTYIDPHAELNGRGAIAAFVGGVQQRFPGVHFRLSGEVDAHRQQARFRWEAGPPGSEPVAIGFDVMLFAGDRIRAVYGFLDKAPT